MISSAPEPTRKGSTLVTRTSLCAGALVAVTCVPNCPVYSADSPVNAINVSIPEVFDNSFLQAQLNAVRAQLTNLQTIDQASLIKGLGQVQGSQLQSSSTNFQILGSPLPQVTTTLPANASIPTASSDTRVTQQAGLTPTVPSVPASSLPLPPGVTPSALDLLSEQMQLGSQVISYELLLGGSSSAKVTQIGHAKRPITLGFSISIDPPTKKHRNQIAEVEVTYCHSAVAADEKDEEPPVIVNLLPQENSYNVLSLTDKSHAFGLGVIAGTVSVGGGISGGTKTQYLIKQQDTVAFRRAVNNDSQCADSSAKSTTFGWQFRPILGESFVRSGMRTMFVQLAVPYELSSKDGLSHSKVYALNLSDEVSQNANPTSTNGTVIVRTRWRCFDQDTGAVGEKAIDERIYTANGNAGTAVATTPDAAIKAMNNIKVRGPLESTPTVSSVSWRDIGGGSVMVTVTGTNMENGRIRLGGTSIDTTSAGFKASGDNLEFVAPVQAIVAGGAYLVAPSGEESEIYPCSPNPNPIPGPSSAPIIVPGWCKWPFDSVVPNDLKIKVGSVTIAPLSDTSSLIEIATNQKILPETTGNFPYVVSLGGQVFGLSNNPFWPTTNATEHANPKITLVASNDVLKAAPVLKVQRLFFGSIYDSDPIPFVPPGQLTITNITSKGSSKCNSSPSKQPEVPGKGSKPKDCVPPATAETTYVVAGAMSRDMKLDSAQLPCHKPQVVEQVQSASLRILRFPACATKNLKQITFRYDAKEPDTTFAIAIALPDDKVPAPASSALAAQPSADATPHFTMARTVTQVVQQNSTATISVGISNFKDQSATISVSGADVTDFTDAGGNTLAMSGPGQATILQNTLLTIHVTNVTTAIKVEAEGKNGTVSTGKVAFNFGVVRQSAASQVAKK